MLDKEGGKIKEAIVVGRLLCVSVSLSPLINKKLTSFSFLDVLRIVVQ